jgi:hypothetical protein
MLLHAPSPDVSAPFLPRTAVGQEDMWTGTGAALAPMARSAKTKINLAEVRKGLCGGRRLLRLIAYAEERPWIFHGHSVNIPG